MAIENIQQLKSYINELPWYKRIFFPWAFQTRLSEPSISESEVREIYYFQIRSSWLGRVYDWLFPEVIGFSQPSIMAVQQDTLNPQLDQFLHPIPENYENALINSILHRNTEEFNRLIEFISTHRVEYSTLIRVLRISMREFYGTRTLLRKVELYSTDIVSRAFIDAAKNTNNDWWGINAIHQFASHQFLNERLNSASINEVVLLLANVIANDHQQNERTNEHDLKNLLNCPNICNKISLATMSQVLLYIIVPHKYESEDSARLVRCILSFKTNDGIGLGVDCIKSAYLQTIKAGRIKALTVFQELTGHEDDLESMIQALRVAAENRHYSMVLHLIKRVPNDRRLKLLQTKAVINGDMSYLRGSQVPEKTHVLQWAACRSVKEDLLCILDALNEQERYTLITNTPNEDDYSPLLLAAINCWEDNLILMLDSLTHGHAIEAILPKTVSFLTPLNAFYSYHKKMHKTDIMPILLTKLFGENQKLYDAYHYLEPRCDWNCLRALRDHYLATHFPSRVQRSLAFFGIGFSIPEHPLSSEELDVVVRVIFYQNYHKLDYIQRGKIEDRMSAYEHPKEATLAAHV